MFKQGTAGPPRLVQQQLGRVTINLTHGDGCPSSGRTRADDVALAGCFFCKAGLVRPVTEAFYNLEIRQLWHSRREVPSLHSAVAC